MNTEIKAETGGLENSPLDWQFVFVKSKTLQNVWVGIIKKGDYDHVSMTTLDGTCDIMNLNHLSNIARYTAQTILSSLAISPTDENIERLIKLFFKKLDLEQEVISISAQDVISKIGS